MNTVEKNTFNVGVVYDGDKIKYYLNDVEVAVDDLVDHMNHLSKPEPKPETLEDRVKAEYGDYDVVMLEWCDQYLCTPSGRMHTSAQSMKGFYKYVYVSINSGFYVRRLPTDIRGDKTVQPIAALSEKVKS